MEANYANAGRVTIFTRDFPCSRWYALPAANVFAGRLSPTAVRPWHVTACGFLSAVMAAVVIASWPEAGIVAAALVWFAWLCDRTDGALARLQRTASQRGAWLDANLDELADVALHVAIAYAVVASGGGQTTWILVILFVAGKYLFAFGLTMERDVQSTAQLRCRDSERDDRERRSTGPKRGFDRPSLLRRLYHLPGNADVRVHILLIALLLGWLEAELWFVAAYYNLRWMARYVLVLNRLTGTEDPSTPGATAGLPNSAFRSGATAGLPSSAFSGNRDTAGNANGVPLSPVKGAAA